MIRTVRIDIWGGPKSLDHLARQHFAYGLSSAPAEWVAYAEAQLELGHLVNLRILSRRESPEDDFGTPPARRTRWANGGH
jgi:hypothetical protein